MSTTIKHICCERGDWEIIEVNGCVSYSGHAIRTHEWIELFEEFSGIKIQTETISDEEMEARQ